LKAKLKSGEYEVDSQKLARNLLLEGLQEGIS
jgi:anti-sigma28 factor (negative regulator of flagellin synthesis)